MLHDTWVDKKCVCKCITTTWDDAAFILLCVWVLKGHMKLINGLNLDCTCISRGLPICLHIVATVATKLITTEFLSDLFQICCTILFFNIILVFVWQKKKLSVRYLNMPETVKKTWQKLPFFLAC